MPESTDNVILLFACRHRQQIKRTPPLDVPRRDRLLVEQFSAGHANRFRMTCWGVVHVTADGVATVLSGCYPHRAAAEAAALRTARRHGYQFEGSAR